MNDSTCSKKEQYSFDEAVDWEIANILMVVAIHNSNNQFDDNTQQHFQESYMPVKIQSTDVITTHELSERSNAMTVH